MTTIPNRPRSPQLESDLQTLVNIVGAIDRLRPVIGTIDVSCDSTAVELLLEEIGNILTAANAGHDCSAHIP